MFDPKKMMEMMQQAQQMQTQFQQELKSKTATGNAGAGMVQVTMNGDFELLQLTIDPVLYAKNDPMFLQDMVRAGVNDAVKKVKDLMSDQVKTMSEKLGLPIG